MPSLNTTTNKAIAAFLAGTSEAVLAPFERVQVLMQNKTFHDHYRHTLHAFRDLRAEYGVREFYRGLVPILLRNGPSNILFFLGRENIRELFPQSEEKWKNVSADFVSGALLGAFISTVFFPINVVKTRMQSTVGGEFQSFRSSAVEIFHERNQSWRKMFRGVHINYTRSLLSWGIINASYEYLKRLFELDSWSKWKCRKWYIVIFYNVICMDENMKKKIVSFLHI